MKAFVITFGVLNAIGIAASLVQLGSSEPWPRPRKPKSAASEVGDIAIHLAIGAWAVYLIFGRGY